MSIRPQQRLRSVRGATTATDNSAAAITEASAELLGALLTVNGLDRAAIVSIVFTATGDLTAEFPAAGAHAVGLSDVSLLCAQEVAVPGAVARCIRVLIHLYSDREALEPVYLRGARDLRARSKAQGDI